VPLPELVNFTYAIKRSSGSLVLQCDLLEKMGVKLVYCQWLLVVYNQKTSG